jgi:predicted transcriptional regulator
VYTTTAKVLDRLHAKGMLVRERQGKAFVYRAAVARSTVHRAETAVSLRRLLGSSPKPGIAVLVETMEAIDPALLDELTRAVAERKARP